MASRRSSLLRPARQGDPADPAESICALVELLRPGGPALARRWLEALLRVPERERPALVESIERQLAARESPSELRVVHPPVQRDGYIEQTLTTYARVEPKPDAGARRRKSSGR